MTSLPTIVVAGYTSWAVEAVNPPASVLAQLQPEAFTNCKLVLRETPVATHRLYEEMEGDILAWQPDAWIGLGLSVHATTIQLEMVGVNWRHFSVPDIDGVTAKLWPVIPDGPVAYGATLPNDVIVQSLNRSQIPAILSFSAGTHLCNQMLYSVRHITETAGLALQSGFIHVPQSTENVADHAAPESCAGSMSIAMMTDAVTIAINLVAERLAQGRSTG